MSKEIGAAKEVVGAVFNAGRSSEYLGGCGSSGRACGGASGHIQTCRRNERLHGAEICRSVRLHLDALLGLPENDVLCIQRVRVADYIEDDFDKCAPFKNPPADWESAGYTPEERKTILEAIEVAKSLDADKARGIVERCASTLLWCAGVGAAMKTKYSVLSGVCLLLAFVAGLGVGRASREKQMPAKTTQVTNLQNVDIDEALAACEDELEAFSQPSPKASATDAMSDEAKQAVAEKAATVEALENELRQCRKSDLGFNATVCLAGSRYFPLFLVELHADRACVDRFGVGDLILQHTERCSMFEDQTDPREMDLGELSNAELRMLYDAQRNGRVANPEWDDHKANLTRHFKRTVRECRVKFGLPDE